MSFSKITALIGGIVFIVILYFIIFYALKIMYKDIKGGGKKRRPSHNDQKNINRRKNHGLEILVPGDGVPLKQGGIIPINADISIGRGDNNTIVLPDQHVSSHHATITIRNEVMYLEDLNSTNGTYINDKRINGMVKLFSRDEVRVGTTVFKVL